ncbi:hypothetical protein BH11VER1_BH11VER1_08830 [soil metagenome]
MPTYVYETIPTVSGEKPHRFELKQSIKDEALRTHPETGEAIYRVITGGTGFVGASASAQKSSGGSCGTGCGCH